MNESTGVPCFMISAHPRDKAENKVIKGQMDFAAQHYTVRRRVKFVP